MQGGGTSERRERDRWQIDGRRTDRAGHSPACAPLAQPTCDGRTIASTAEERTLTTDDDAYLYDEATGEWRPASEMAAAKAAASVARDASGNVLTDGDAVVLIKDLKVKGANQTLKQGTVIRSIRLTDDPEEIDCRHETIKGLVLRTEFVRKR